MIRRPPTVDDDARLTYEAGGASAGVRPSRPTLSDPPQGNLFAYFKANTGITRDMSDAVSQWDDFTGNGHDAPQSTGSKQPLFVSNLLNGFPAIRFDGINDDLKTSSFTSESNMTSWLVVREQLHDCVDDGRGGCAGQRGMVDGGVDDEQIVFTDPATLTRINTFSGGAGMQTDNAPGINVWYLLVIRWQSSNLGRMIVHNLDTDTQLEDKTGNFVSPSFTGITMGSRGSAALGFAEIEIAEYGVYNEASSDAKINNLVIYVRRKFV